MSSSVDRRKFLETASATGIGLMASSRIGPLLAQRGPPGEKVVVAIMGLNGRGAVLGRVFAGTRNVEVSHVCDVDAQVLAKCVAALGQAQPKTPRGLADFRRALDDKAVDALVIAAPDHWHTPAAILALEAGKHVYLEKPGGHNAREAELLADAQRKYRRLVQFGTQRRSSPRAVEAIQAISEGVIGRPYYARGWYANRRQAIGRGKVAPVPAGLDYELWQGPAPRTPYRDNVIHYNWHWFRRWGTGEICNNGTHEIDVCRWALGVDYPSRVTSVGGRYHLDDEREFPDTQEVGFEFDNRKTIVWQGLSASGFPTQGRSRGVSVQGTEGTIVLDQDGYTVYDPENKVVRESITPPGTDPVDARADDPLTVLHVANFVEAIRTGQPLSAPIADGHRTALLCHLGNIAQQTGRALRTDPTSGRILGDDDAMRSWQRDYAPGWAPAV